MSVLVTSGIVLYDLFLEIFKSMLKGIMPVFPELGMLRIEETIPRRPISGSR